MKRKPSDREVSERDDGTLGTMLYGFRQAKIRRDEHWRCRRVIVVSNREDLGLHSQMRLGRISRARELYLVAPTVSTTAKSL